MTTADKTELALIPLLGAGLLLAAPLLSDKMGLERVLLSTSALLLLQGLIRDVWLLASRKRGKAASQPRRARCLCVESAVGLSGILAGLLLLGSEADYPITLNHWQWGILLMATMTSGFLIKDLVLEWNPLRLRRDRDHINIVVDWRH